MDPSFDFVPVDRLSVGTIGQVGKRTFLLQVKQQDNLITLKIEKAQVAALAEYLVQLLQEVQKPNDFEPSPDLEEPIIPQWRVGNIALAYDESTDLVTLLIEEIPSEQSSNSSLTILATRAQVAALAIQATSLVQAGRPPCPLCGYPLDPKGHTCPKKNGHKPPTL